MRDNPKLVAQVEWQFKSAVFFILCHEVGHIVLGHRVLADGLTPSASRSQETAADAFALEIMHSIGQTPEGLVYYFLFASVLEWFAVDGHIGTAPYRTHPLSVERIKAITDYIRRNAAGFVRVQADTRRGERYFLALADQVETAVNGVLDGDYAQRRWQQIGRVSTPRNLGPRAPTLLGQLGQLGQCHSRGGHRDFLSKDQGWYSHLNPIRNHDDHPRQGQPPPRGKPLRVTPFGLHPSRLAAH